MKISRNLCDRFALVAALMLLCCISRGILGQEILDVTTSRPMVAEVPRQPLEDQLASFKVISDQLLRQWLAVTEEGFDRPKLEPRWLRLVYDQRILFFMDFDPIYSYPGWPGTSEFDRRLLIKALLEETEKSRELVLQ